MWAHRWGLSTRVGRGRRDVATSPTFFVQSLLRFVQIPITYQTLHVTLPFLISRTAFIVEIFHETNLHLYMYKLSDIGVITFAHFSGWRQHPQYERRAWLPKLWPPPAYFKKDFWSHHQALGSLPCFSRRQRISHGPHTPRIVSCRASIYPLVVDPRLGSIHMWHVASNPVIFYAPIEPRHTTGVATSGR